MVAAKNAVIPTPTVPIFSRSLFQHGSFACVLMTSDGRIASVTRSFAQMLGCPVRLLFGQNITRILAPDTTPKLSSLLADGLETTLVTRNGKTLHWTVNRLAQGAALGGYFVGFLYDEEPLIEMDQRLIHQERLAMLGRLTATVSHEIVGPLSNLANSAELLLGKDEIDEETQESLAGILEEADRIQALLRSILRFARNAPLTTEPQDVAQIVRKSAEISSSQSRSSGVDIKVDVEPDLPRVAGDAEYLQQVFSNLIKNACDAAEGATSSQKVMIRLAKGQLNTGEPAVEITVDDQGKGIHPSDLQHVFEPFFSTKPAGEGTGLGLTISQRIVDAHRGEMRLSSMVGNGTRVTVLLPVFSQTKTQKRRANSESSSSRGQRFVTTK